MAEGVYQQILDLTRRQAAAAGADNVDDAIALFGERGVLVAAAPKPTSHEEVLIREILALDKVVAGAIRKRMIAIRNEAVGMHHGKQALAGYARVNR